MPYSTLDAALEIVASDEPDLSNTSPNHAPMVAEALSALGYDDAVQDWIATRDSRAAGAPGSDKRLRGDWREALGDASRSGEWQALFRLELTEMPWADVLDRWLPRLIAGCMASGTHGIIRCGHAARALENEITPPRLNELARALAYSATCFRPLSAELALDGALDTVSALERVPLMSDEIDRAGPPPRIVRQLEGWTDFAEAVERLAPPLDVRAELSSLAEAGARLYLRNASRYPLVLLHAVTGPSALQLIVPHLSAASNAIVFAYMWQASCAWASAFGNGLESDISPVDFPWERIVERAVASGDEHAIKFTEAARRQEALTASPVFRAAAYDWILRVERSTSLTADQLVSFGIRTQLS